MTAQQNVAWQSRVRQMLREGFGVEDIAIETVSTEADVRLEIKCLRDEGELDKIYRNMRKRMAG